MKRLFKIKVLPEELRIMLLSTFNRSKENTETLSVWITTLFKKYGDCLDVEDLIQIMKEIDELSYTGNKKLCDKWIDLKNWCHKKTRLMRGF